MSDPSDGDRPRALADAMPVSAPVAPAPPPAEPDEVEDVRPSGWDAIAAREQEGSQPKPSRFWSRFAPGRASARTAAQTPQQVISPTESGDDGAGWDATASRSSSDEWESAAGWDDDDFSPPIGGGRAAWADDAAPATEDAGDTGSPGTAWAGAPEKADATEKAHAAWAADAWADAVSDDISANAAEHAGATHKAHAARPGAKEKSGATEKAHAARPGAKEKSGATEKAAGAPAPGAWASDAEASDAEAGGSKVGGARFPRARAGLARFGLARIGGAAVDGGREEAAGKAAKDGEPEDGDSEAEGGADGESEGEDYDVYDARSPIRSNRDAWLGVAWVLAFTAMAGLATHLFLDGPDEITAQGASVKLNDIRVVDSVGPTGPATNDGVRKIKVSVIKPETLGGRPTSSEVEPEALDFMSAYTDGEIVSGAYGELDDQNFVLMSAVTSAHLLYPDSQLGTLLDQLQADDPNLTDPQPVPAGILAGIARCGESKFGDKPKVVCFWVDEQCMGVITWFDQPLAKVLEEFLPLREQIEHQL